MAPSLWNASQLPPWHIAMPLEGPSTSSMVDEARCSDQHTVFRVAQRGARTGHGMTQFGRALNELNVEILCANSSQARGRVERANRTQQDLLVEDLRLAAISGMEAANAILPGLTERSQREVRQGPAPRRQPAPGRSMSSPTAFGASCATGTRAMSASSLPSPTTGGGSFSRRKTSRASCPASMSTAKNFRMVDWNSDGRACRYPTRLSTRTRRSRTRQ